MTYPKNHFSYSAFSKFTQCPRRWWFDYVKYPEEKEEIFAFKLGNAYHDAIKLLYKGTPLSKAVNEFDKQMGVYSFKSKGAVDNIRKAIEYYYSAIYPLYRGRVRNVEVEKEIKMFDIKIPFMFRIDLETIDGVLVDHKTVGGRAPRIELSEQMDLYSLLYLSETGRLPRAVEYHLAYKSPGKKDRVQIKSHMPNLGEALKTLSKVRASLSMIEKNILPTNRGPHCAYCPFRSECDSLIITSDGKDTI